MLAIRVSLRENLSPDRIRPETAQVLRDLDRLDRPAITKIVLSAIRIGAFVNRLRTNSGHETIIARMSALLARWPMCPSAFLRVCRARAEASARDLPTTAAAVRPRSGAFGAAGGRVSGGQPGAGDPEKRSELQPVAKLLRGGAAEYTHAADFGAKVWPDRSITNI
jgi:hypothetical protein